MKAILLALIIFTSGIAYSQPTDSIKVQLSGQSGFATIPVSTIASYPGLVVFTSLTQPVKKMTMVRRLAFLCGSQEVYKVSSGFAFENREITEPIVSIEFRGRDTSLDGKRLVSTIGKYCGQRSSTLSLEIPISHSKFKESEQYGTFILPAQTRIEGGYVFLWTVQYRLAVQHEKFNDGSQVEFLTIDSSQPYHVSQSVYNCSNRTSRNLSDTRYSDSGSVLYSFEFKNSSFDPVIPNSVGEAQFNFACGMV